MSECVFRGIGWGAVGGGKLPLGIAGEAQLTHPTPLHPHPQLHTAPSLRGGGARPPRGRANPQGVREVAAKVQGQDDQVRRAGSLLQEGGERAKRASLDEDEHTRDESHEMATEIMATSTSTTELTLFHSILLTPFTRFALASLKMTRTISHEFTRRRSPRRNSSPTSLGPTRLSSFSRLARSPTRQSSRNRTST